MTEQKNSENLKEGRGPGVTAITAILNLNDHPFNFEHLKYPSYNRVIPPGFFKYPWGTTAPINWGSNANELIKFGDMGTMWQHNEGPWHVRYKAGGNPVTDADGEIVYSRRHSIPGEHYLILGVKGNEVTTLKSYTPEEALLENLTDAILSALNILKPADYKVIATNPGLTRTFMDRVKKADEAGNFQGLDPKDIKALMSKSYQDFENQLAKLSPEERTALESGEATPEVITIVKRIFEGLGIVIGGVAAGLGIIAGLLAIMVALSGPAGWALGTALVALFTFIAGVVGVIAGFLLLVGWILSWFEDMESMALLEEVPL